MVTHPHPDVVGVVDQVVVGEGHSLGLAGGAAGELDVGGLVHLDPVGQALHPLHQPRAGVGQHLAKPECAGRSS